MRIDRPLLWVCWLAGLVGMLQVDGCGAATSPGMIFTDGRQPPPDIAEACDLAAKRCSRCHPTDRILIAHVTRPSNWVWYVERMRHQPESGISEDEGRTIARCLVFHSFGPQGLGALAEGTP